MCEGRVRHSVRAAARSPTTARTEWRALPKWPKAGRGVGLAELGARRGLGPPEGGTTSWRCGWI